MIVIDEMVNRFLAWTLPKSVCADGCATNPNYPHPRSGTNLLNAIEARQMLEHVLAEESGDPGTEKLLRDLLDRGYKMHVQAGTLHIAEQNSDHNDPLIAWLSDVRAVIYGNTKPTPRGHP